VLDSLLLLLLAGLLTEKIKEIKIQQQQQQQQQSHS
jgi:hypothetical protein